jgi:leucyl/phenylalanyl-tRNA--protein transferase
MPVFELDDTLWFPPVSLADPDGLLAVGGDLSTERLLLAYRIGIFPWYNPGEPILWWSPNPRMVLYPAALKVSNSMKQVLRSGRFRVTLDTAFSEVINACANTPRNGEYGTWIVPDMIHAYTQLHHLGWAHSVEVWEGDVLMGGLYGIGMGKVFCGESMFSRQANASKAGFITLVQWLVGQGVHFIDCQTHTPHLESLGAKLIPQSEYLVALQAALQDNLPVGKWQL